VRPLRSRTRSQERCADSSYCQRAAAAKKAREEAKLAKEVEVRLEPPLLLLVGILTAADSARFLYPTCPQKEQRQLMRRQLVDQTRQQREDKKDEQCVHSLSLVLSLES